MNPQVVLCMITGSGFDVTHQDATANSKLQFRSDTVPVAPGTDGSNQEGVAAIAAIVPKHVGGLSIIPNHEIHIAVVVQIPDSQPTAHLFQRKPGAGTWPDITELSGAVIFKKEVSLFVAGIVAKARHIVDDVPVDDNQILVRIVVIVDESRAETHKRQRGFAHSAFECKVRKQTLAEILEQAVCFAVQVGDDDVEEAVAIHVGHIGSHSRQRPSFDTECDASPESDFFKTSLSLVVEKEIRHGIVGDINIVPSVTVIVSKNHTEPVSVRTVNAGFLRHVGKGTVTVVAIEDVRKAVVDIRMAVHAKVSRCRTVLIVVDGKVNVVGHEEIHIAIVVDVAKGATGTPAARAACPAFVGDVGEPTAAIVSV